ARLAGRPVVVRHAQGRTGGSQAAVAVAGEAVGVLRAWRSERGQGRPAGRGDPALSVAAQTLAAIGRQALVVLRADLVRPSVPVGQAKAGPRRPVTGVAVPGVAVVAARTGRAQPPVALAGAWYPAPPILAWPLVSVRRGAVLFPRADLAGGPVAVRHAARGVRGLEAAVAVARAAIGVLRARLPEVAHAARGCAGAPADEGIAAVRVGDARGASAALGQAEPPGATVGARGAGRARGRVLQEIGGQVGVVHAWAAIEGIQHVVGVEILLDRHRRP